MSELPVHGLKGQLRLEIQAMDGRQALVVKKPTGYLWCFSSHSRARDGITWNFPHSLQEYSVLLANIKHLNVMYFVH
jgi:hypothetical protein